MSDETTQPPERTAGAFREPIPPRTPPERSRTLVRGLGGSIGRRLRRSGDTDAGPLPPLTHIPASDHRIGWSPYTWYDTTAGRSCPTVGAYLEVAFSGDTLGIAVDTSSLTGPDRSTDAIVVSLRLDGAEPDRQSLDRATAGRLVWRGLGPGPHVGRITLAKNANFSTRWMGDPPAALTITHVLVEGKPGDLPTSHTTAPRALFYGDSITEGNDIESFGTFGDNSFAVVAMDRLGFRFGLHAHSLLMWQHDFLAKADVFVDPASGDLRPDVNWMNHHRGRPMLTDTDPPRYLQGPPEVILNHIGVNDIAIVHGNVHGHRPSSEYLAPAITAWTSQVRAAAGPDTHIVFIEPLAYQGIYPHLADDRDKVEATRRVYRQGIEDHRRAHPDDDRVHLIVLGTEATDAALAHDGVPYPSSSIHFRPEASQVIGRVLAHELKSILG